MSLGEVLRRRREELGLTQDDVAPRVGISKPYLSNIETDKVKNPPSDQVLKGLEAALGFRRGELLRMAHLVRTPLDVRTEHERLEAEVQKLRSAIRQLLAGRARGKTKGSTKAKGAVNLDALARRLKVRPGNISRMLSAGRPIPVINRVAAGYPHHFTDLDYPPSVADEYVRCPDVHDPQAFAARVVGDSMEPKYVEGDTVVFSPNTTPVSGKDCFVRFAKDNSTTFKRFFEESDGRIRLQPLNEKYPAETYDPEEISGLWPAVMRIERLA